MTDWAKVRKRAGTGLRRAVHYMAPVAKVAKETTQVLATIAKPTPVGVINAAGSAVSTLAELISPPEDTPAYMRVTYVDAGTLQAAFRKAKWIDVARKESRGGSDNTKVGSHDFIRPGTDHGVRVGPNGTLYFWDDPDDNGMWDATGKVVDQHLPPVIQLMPAVDENERSYVTAAKLTHLTPGGTEAILRRSLALLGPRRAILLEGRPGVGKTTMAMAMAREANLGRVLILSNQWLNRGRINTYLFTQLNTGTIIVDDIDKVSVGLGAFEVIRNSCRLLILTANNGTYDKVIDAALSRPARIDEVFTVTTEAPLVRPPFDRLPQPIWERVSQWPQAYLNELELRLTHTPDDLRLEDLATRLGKRTRSAEGLLGDEPEPDDLDWLSPLNEE